MHIQDISVSGSLYGTHLHPLSRYRSPPDSLEEHVAGGQTLANDEHLVRSATLHRLISSTVAQHRTLNTRKNPISPISYIHQQENVDDDDQTTLIESDQHGGGWRRTCTSNDDTSDDTSDDDSEQVHNAIYFLCLSQYVQMSSP